MIKQLSLELSTLCNARCDFCTRTVLMRTKQRPCRYLLENELQERLNSVSERFPEAEWISPVGLGEPLLYPHIWIAIKMIRELWPDARIGINTNGSLPMSWLLDEIDAITVSLCYPTRRQHNTHLHLDYDAVKKNISNLLKEGEASSTRIRIHIFDTPVNRILFPMFFLEYRARIRNGWVYLEKLLPLTTVPDISPQEGTIMIDIDGNIFNSCMGVWYPRTMTDAIYLGKI